MASSAVSSFEIMPLRSSSSVGIIPSCTSSSFSVSATATSALTEVRNALLVMPVSVSLNRSASSTRSLVASEPAEGGCIPRLDREVGPDELPDLADHVQRLAHYDVHTTLLSGCACRPGRRRTKPRDPTGKQLDRCSTTGDTGGRSEDRATNCACADGRVTRACET